MSDKAFQDGKIPFKVDSLDVPCETYYKVYGDLHNSGPTPLLILHGGPGAGHEYMEPYKALWTRYGIPVIFYDQIGCASSTHLQSKKGDHSFWQPDLFLAELDNLLRHLDLGGERGMPFDVFGHSWGGILAIAFAAAQPKGLRRLILGGAPSDQPVRKAELWRLIRQLPADVQQEIDKAVREDDFTTPAYREAFRTFTATFLCRVQPWPKEFLKNQSNQAEDNTVRYSMSVNDKPLNKGS